MNDSPRPDLPPPIDLVGHLRDLSRALPAAVAVALIVGAAVFGLRATLSPKQYSAAMVTEIVPAGNVVPGDAFVEQLRAPFIALASDTNVLNEVLTQVDTGWDAATLDQHINTTPGPAPNLLVYTATADSPELAPQIVRSLIVTVTQASVANSNRDKGQQVQKLQAAIAAERARNAAMPPGDPNKIDSDQQIADLQEQFTALATAGSDQLRVLSTPVPSDAPVAPRPIYEALVAALATLIVAAELIVVWRSRVGSKPNMIWARRIARKNRARLGVGEARCGGLSVAAAGAVAHDGRTGGRTLLLLGDGVHVSEAAAGNPAVVRAGVNSDWWSSTDLAELSTAVIVISGQAADRKSAERALGEIRDLAKGVRSYLVLQQSERKRRNADDVPTTPATPPAPENVDSHVR